MALHCTTSMKTTYSKIYRCARHAPSITAPAPCLPLLAAAWNRVACVCPPAPHRLDLALQVTFRLHRKLILGAIGSLKEQQPAGAAEPGSLWQYIHADPTTAALYVSGVLCTPRLTMLWLHIFEYNATLGPLLADEDERNPQVPHRHVCPSPHAALHQHHRRHQPPQKLCPVLPRAPAVASTIHRLLHSPPYSAVSAARAPHARCGGVLCSVLPLCMLSV